ncbi:MAG: glycoside hydrolase family 3 C-terminal domain-containing protein [Bacteroidales bacterium]|nr:glycoside hydrolase family 3 C-terminal domain-containing protein [Bacteroidales bacterium]
MRNIKTFRAFLFLIPVIILVCFLTSCKKWTENEKETFSIVTNRGGQTLGYSPTSDVKLIFDKGFAFKDLNKNGELDKYEDWRLTVDERAKDLASKMSIEQISGLMLYSAHQTIPASGGRFGGTYNGKKLAESEANSWNLSDQQIDFLTNDNLRHVLITRVESPEVAARWNNNVQALVEGIGMGIPANNSSDPRHRSIANAEYNAGAGSDISMWPGSLGLAATFDPDIMKKFGEIASTEYRALGIATALSPQIDLATEPRWNRVNGTFGEDPQLSTDMTRAYVDGFQSSTGNSEISGGWGYLSVNAMVKHWPGGGSGEGGRDAHFGYGKYAIYPGNAFNEHLIPFTEGAFKLEGKTGMAAAIMPYYTISFNQDTQYGENVGNSYSQYIINDLLRTKYNFDGVVCTDWAITNDESSDITNRMGGGRCWGVEENFTVAERHYMIIMAGVDQFGGNNDAGPVIDAYNIGVQELGESAMRARFEESAVRLLKNIFRVGLFENPYLDSEESVTIVGKAGYITAGYNAQLKSIVMLKNKDNALPLEKNKTVFVPKKYTPAGRNWFGNAIPESYDYPVNMDIVKKYFNVTDNPDEADYAIVFIDSPNTGSGYSAADVEAGSNGYVPMSLQYGTYTAKYARDPSIAGDPRDILNRTYKNRTVTPSNTTDLAMVLDTKEVMNGKLVIVSLNMSNPAVFGEFEKNVDAIVINFGVQEQAILDILTGKTKPSALLPMQMPANMKTVEEQYEDVPHDMDCYVDSEGNTYDFAFGLSWTGVINDARTAKYKK